MNKYETIKRRDRKVNEFINEVASDDLDPKVKEAEIISYKVGFRDCIDEFAVLETIDALIYAYKAIDSLPDDALGRVRPSDRFEEYPVKYELVHNIRKALKKAGVEL